MKAHLLTALWVTASVALATESNVPYPTDYRNWHHVKSMVIEEGHPLFNAFGGIHHIYANDKALEGYRKGLFPDGAVIIFDLLDTVRTDNAVTESRRKVLGVMHKDSAKFAATGGWGFEGFGGGDPTNRVVGDKAASACFACHQPQKGQDYTFSQLRD
ncbi:MAG: cytochrome P460 family protein [Candidatus Thiodiazotropha sp. (ex. Lucinisca nassula)]|nr:cytochrome P460 family protein [Candidatus Thiodiazotropha sp. (ex. Lucinisca nassula)]MBW9272981.1 cytochrome P460 family protein [Candidatus Thiodiazotropha sp. (ex. Lucinisca nassula)]PUB85688.1 MAG: cytochrome C [gamma proteobacterium symbiont of Ctena orbiculata]PUB85892.1 MAG: cytochrome C [gamma proteobacterium symbiont of Ctena orbiculata]